jgi:hypothetical protein
LGAQSCLSAIIENLDLEKPSFGPSKWPRKLKPAKNSKLPKWPENCFEPFGNGGWPPISTWINEGAWVEAVVVVVSFCSPFEQIVEKMNFVV